SVVGGTEAAIAELERHLERRQIQTRRLSTSHAFHTGMVEPVLPIYEQALERAVKGNLRVPFISNRSGEWAQAGEVQTAEYWLRHTRQPVLFSAGVNTIAAQGNWVWLEVGPGGALSRLVKQTLLSKQGEGKPRHEMVTMLVQSGDTEPAGVCRSVAQLWTYGAEVNWNKLTAQPRKLRRISLPTYAFDRQPFWIQHRRQFGPQTQDHAAQPRRTVPAPVAIGESDRRANIVGGLKTIISEKSGVDTAGLTGSESFFDLGFDSLLLLQISQGIKIKFGVDVPFRMLIEEYPV